MIPFASTLYLLPFIASYVLVKKPHYLPQFVLVLIYLGILAIPYVFNFHLPPQSTFDWVRDWQQDPERNPNWQLGLGAIPDFIFRSYQLPTLILVVIGLFQLKKQQYRSWFILTFTVLILMLINNRSWFLPLSALLYPDRLITIFTPVIAFLSAAAIKFISTYPPKIKYSPLILALLVLIPLPFYPYATPLAAITYHANRFNDANYFVLTTPDDLIAIKWLAANTPPDTIIENQYGDASLWIPAIAYRSITDNDAGVFEINEVGHWYKTHPPADYLFIGGRQVYGKSHYDPISLTPPRYQLVFEAGDSKLYKINKNAALYQ